MAGLIGKKIGMTRIFNDEGFAVPVTVVEAGPCPVIQVKTAQAAVAVTEKSILTARESLRITRDKAALDYGTAADVLDAQAALLQAETAHSAALAELNTAFALLDLAVGGTS